MVNKNGPLIAFDGEFAVPQFFFGPSGTSKLYKVEEDMTLMLTRCLTSPALTGRGEHQCARGESHDRLLRSSTTEG